MNFARVGYPFMGASGVIAISVIAASVWRRSWSLWLLGFLLLVIAASVAWYFRVPSSDAVPSVRTSVAGQPA